MTIQPFPSSLGDTQWSRPHHQVQKWHTEGWIQTFPTGVALNVNGHAHITRYRSGIQKDEYRHSPAHWVALNGHAYITRYRSDIQKYEYGPWTALNGHAITRNSRLNRRMTTIFAWCFRMCYDSWIRWFLRCNIKFAMYFNITAKSNWKLRKPSSHVQEVLI
jgi:hypothetical protein